MSTRCYIRDMREETIVTRRSWSATVDGGALKVEFFSKFFEAICKQMFEQTPNE